ncbi:unnamed protein product [Lactuca virosa]|uniref:No apical meristem-associated C-terminal domain-containing protein n=1 Tax=Lactuca virosa TaxID=75947 RepID=A0AAU9PJY3_9ASTR|nr:unnamed protein product [Lactuca virosa]
MLTTNTHFSTTIRHQHHLTGHKWMVFLALIHNFKCPNNSISNLNLKPNFHPNLPSHLQPNTKNSNNNLNNKRKGRLIREDGHKKKKLKRFCRGMSRSPDYRTSDQCNSKWNLMNKVFTQWNGIYTNFEKQWASGESEVSLLKKTHTTFQDDMQKSFKFIHVREVVNRNIRWRELATHEDIANLPKRSRTSSYSSSQQVSSDGRVGVNLNDDNDDIEEICPPPRPMGRDKTKARAKGKGKATSSNSSVGTEQPARLEEMMTQMTQLNSTLERHMDETVRITEYTLLMQDVRHLDP